jgi:hypothetical protein
VTPEEIQLLKAICDTGQQRFGVRRKTAAAAQVFDELVEALERMQRYGWVELEVLPAAGQQAERYRRKYRHAVARCTEQGREVLRLLSGEEPVSAPRRAVRVRIRPEHASGHPTLPVGVWVAGWLWAEDPQHVHLDASCGVSWCCIFARARSPF